MTSDETTVEIPRGELFELYSLLADATTAASTGDPNQCASKAADAKERVKELGEKYE